MTKQIATFFSAPIFPGDEEKTRTASLLNTILLRMAVLLALASLAVWLVFDIKQATTVSIILLFLLLILSWIIMRLGKVRQACMIFVTGLGLAATALVWFSGGITTIDGTFYLATVIITGLLLGRRAARIMALFTLVIALGILILQKLGYLTPRAVPLSPESGWLVLFFAIFLTVTALNLALRQLDQAIEKGQQEIAQRQRIEMEREQLIANLEAKNTELERFTYTVSHDLRSPLITIRGFLGFLEKDVQAGKAAQIKTDMERITNATNKMQQLLDELLELSRVGRMMNPPQLVLFETIAREAVELVSGRIAARGVQVSIAERLPMVLGDRTRLVQVMQNLIDNAVKFMGNQSAPRIEIGMRGKDADDKPILYVRDNGIGIEPRYQNQIFNLFNKLDAQTEGTGIGLALVKRIIEVHGGKIWIESEGLGKGTTFYFTLAPAKHECSNGGITNQ